MNKLSDLNKKSVEENKEPTPRVSVAGNCAICLDEIETLNKAKLNPCLHTYCIECI